MRAAHDTETDADLAAEAARWFVLLDSEDASEREQAQRAFAAWRARSTRHAEAAARLESFVGGVRQVAQASPGGAQAVHAALDAARQSEDRARRGRALGRTAGALALVALLAAPSWLLLQPPSPASWLADVRSGSGEWTRRTLSDQSRLTLAGAAAVNWRENEHERVLELVRGSVLVDVAKDAKRPFYVQTPLARIRALGTRFVVSYDDSGLRLEMLESRVAVQPQQMGPAGDRRDAVIVQAGQRLQVGSAGIEPVQSLDTAAIERGWQRHQLVVDDRPLPQVLDELARHHAGPLRFDRQALAGIRVSGVLPLDDTAQALELLQQNFPQLRVRTFASWVWVGLQPLS